LERRLAERGLRNVLRHCGLLSGEVETRRSLGLPDAVILRVTAERPSVAEAPATPVATRTT
jgi:hypothetical protein